MPPTVTTWFLNSQKIFTKMINTSVFKFIDKLRYSRSFSLFHSTYLTTVISFLILPVIISTYFCPISEMAPKIKYETHWFRLNNYTIIIKYYSEVLTSLLCISSNLRYQIQNLNDLLRSKITDQITDLRSKQVNKNFFFYNQWAG